MANALGFGRWTVPIEDWSVRVTAEEVKAAGGICRNRGRLKIRKGGWKDHIHH